MLRSMVSIILSFSLMVTFLTRFIEITNKLYPDTSQITIGMSSLPSYLNFLIQLGNMLNTRTTTLVILLLITFVFVYEFATLIRKLVKKPQLRNYDGRK